MARGQKQAGQDGVPAAKLAELLSQAGRVPVTAADIAADVQAGAPVASDGRIPLLPYIRWLHGQVVKGAA